jgi:hypothetical protein
MKKESTARKSLQKGQAYAETVVSFGVIALFLMGSHHLWKYAEVRQQIIDATRFAAWERTVWEPEDNDVEKFAVHQKNDALARNVLMHQLSTPAAWRKHRTSLNGDGIPAESNTVDDRNNLKHSMRNFVSEGNDPKSLITVKTFSAFVGWMDNQSKYRGMDPTFNKITSLSLDRETYRTTETNFNSQLNPTIENRLFSFMMTPVTTSKKLSLITNSWAASPAVNTIRTERELLPLSTGHEGSGTKANNLAYFGMGSNVGLGLAPWWDFVGGANGLGGQFLVRQIGMDALTANGMLQSSGQSWHDIDPLSPSKLILKAQRTQNEYFQPNWVSPWLHRHSLITDASKRTMDDLKEGLDKPTDASIGKRKYKAISLSNPFETFSSP